MAYTTLCLLLVVVTILSTFIVSSVAYVIVVPTTTTTVSAPLSNNSNDRRMTILYQAADAWTGGDFTSNTGSTGTSRLSSGGGYGSIEQIEFKIYPDGRVEELVRGIKGNNCHKITEKINEQLGEVIASRPTEEMYEQEVQVSQTLYNTDSSSNNSDWSSSW
jgi:uncharacterized membrane protein